MTCLRLEVLESRCLPSAVPTYHGGLVQTDPALATLVAGTPPPNFQALINTVVNDYLATDLGAFGVRSASWNGNAQTGDPGPLSDAGVQQLILQEINAGMLPQPLSTNQQYLVELNHPVTDVPGAGAYHSWFYDGGQLVVYDVVWPSASGDTIGDFHEAAEAATDSTGQGWRADGVANGEVCDLASSVFPLNGFQAAAMIGPNGQTITGPTPYTPVVPSPPAAPVALAAPPDILSSIAAWWQQEINAVVSAWQAWETALVSVETQLWNELAAWPAP